MITLADPPATQPFTGATKRTAGWPSMEIPGTGSNMPGGQVATSESRSAGRPLMITEAAPVTAQGGMGWAMAARGADSSTSAAASGARWRQARRVVTVVVSA